MVMTLDTRYSNELYNMGKKADSTGTEQLQFDYKGTSEMVDGQGVQKTYSSVTATSEALNRALSVVVSGDIATGVDISKITNAHEQPNSLCRSEADITARGNFPGEHNIITYTDEKSNQFRVVYDDAGNPVRHYCRGENVMVSVYTKQGQEIPYLKDVSVDEMKDTYSIEKGFEELMKRENYPTKVDNLEILYKKLNSNNEDIPYVDPDDEKIQEEYYNKSYTRAA